MVRRKRWRCQLDVSTRAGPTTHLHVTDEHLQDRRGVQEEGIRPQLPHPLCPPAPTALHQLPLPLGLEPNFHERSASLAVLAPSIARTATGSCPGPNPPDRFGEGPEVGEGLPATRLLGLLFDARRVHTPKGNEARVEVPARRMGVHACGS